MAGAAQLREPQMVWGDFGAKVIGSGPHRVAITGPPRPIVGGTS